MQVQFLLPAPRRCGQHIARSDFLLNSYFAPILSQPFSKSNPPRRLYFGFSPGYHGIFALYQNNAPFLARKTRPVFYGSCKQSAAFSAPRSPSPCVNITLSQPILQ